MRPPSFSICSRRNNLLDVAQSSVAPVNKIRKLKAASVNRRRSKVSRNVKTLGALNAGAGHRRPLTWRIGMTAPVFERELGPFLIQMSATFAFCGSIDREFPSHTRPPRLATRQTTRSRSAKPATTPLSPREAPFHVL
jgi:hypothetical protein